MSGQLFSSHALTGAGWDKLVADIAPFHFFDLVASATA